MRQKPRRSSISVRIWAFLTIGLMLGLSLLLMGCTSTALGEGTAIANSSDPTIQGQMLPITAEVTMRDQVIQLEVARTPREQAIGLMQRTSLADDRGMLFPFSPARPVQFWMKGCLIPLDMVFIRQGIVRHIAPSAPPCTADPCPLYGPRVIIDQVIELRGGRAAELGLQVGDRAPVRFLEQ